MELFDVIGEGVRRGEEGGWREERRHRGLNCTHVSSCFLNVGCHSNELPMPESEWKTGGEGKRLLLNTAEFSFSRRIVFEAVDKAPNFIYTRAAKFYQIDTSWLQVLYNLICLSGRAQNGIVCSPGCQSHHVGQIPSLSGIVESLSQGSLMEVESAEIQLGRHQSTQYLPHHYNLLTYCTLLTLFTAG